jgi:hypothetical protein
LAHTFPCLCFGVGHDIDTLGIYLFGDTLFLRGNVIVGRHFPKENIPNSRKHEQDKKTTYGTLNIHVANQGFPESSSPASMFFQL